MSVAEPSFGRELRRHGFARWALAALLVAALHAAVVFAVLHRQPPSPASPAVDAVEIDLSPAEAPHAAVPPTETASSQADPSETKPYDANQPDAKPSQDDALQDGPRQAMPSSAEAAEAERPVDPPVAMPPAPQASPPLPDLPVLPQSEAVLEPSKPDVEAQRARVVELQKEQRQKVRLEAQRLAKLEQQREAAQRLADARKAQARREAQARASTARQASEPRATSSASLGDWQGQVAARVNAAKQTLAGGGVGVAGVSFTVDGGGRVGGARVSTSSGSPALDQAAVATIRRVGSVPPPPTGRPQPVNVRIRFGG